MESNIDGCTLYKLKLSHVSLTHCSEILIFFLPCFCSVFIAWLKNTSNFIVYTMTGSRLIRQPVKHATVNIFWHNLFKGLPFPLREIMSINTVLKNGESYMASWEQERRGEGPPLYAPLMHLLPPDCPFCLSFRPTFSKKWFSAGRMNGISYLTAAITSKTLLRHLHGVIENFLSFLSQELRIFACAYELPHFNTRSQTHRMF